MKRTVPGCKSHRPNRIENRKFRFEILILTSVFVILISVFSVMAVNIHNNGSKEVALFRAGQTAEKFHSFISKTLILVQKASNSNAIKSWFSDEENPLKREIAYQEMKDYSRVLSDPHLYFGIEKSLGDFSFRPGTAFEEFAPYKKLDPHEPWDSWYFECLDSDKEYVLNFDKDLDTQIWKLWINHKVRAEPDVSGVFCAGFDVKDLYSKLFSDYVNGREQGFLIDEHGVILMSSDSTEYYSRETNTNITDMCVSPRFKAMLKNVLLSENTAFPQTAVMKSPGTPFRYSSIARIPETGWAVVVVFDSNYLTGFAGIVDFLPIPLALIITMIVHVIVSNIHTSLLVFKPLFRLTGSIAESETNDSAIYGYERADEIGDLSRAIHESRERLNSAFIMLHDVILGKEKKTLLLHAVNKTAAILLTLPEEEDKFKNSLLEAMGAIGVCLHLDRVCVWRTEALDDVLFYVPQYEWRSDAYRNEKNFQGSRKLSCDEHPVWTAKFTRGECVNGPVDRLTKSERDILSYNKLKSVLLVPIHLRNKLWGFVNFGDCRNERSFDDDEINILRSAGLMIVSAIDHNMQTAKIREAQEYTKLMLDATPLACHLWDRSFNSFDCNEEAVKFYGLKTKREFNERFLELSPEYQSNGKRSSEAAVHYIRRAFDKGRVNFQWMHQLPDGTPVPAEVTLVRVPYGDDYVVAGYTRDLREHNKMMREIEQKDIVLQTMNLAALVFLAREGKSFERMMSEGLDLFTGLTDIDRVSVFRNSKRPDGSLCFSQIYRWRKDSGGTIQVWDELNEVSYSDVSPRLTAILMSGECISGPVSQLPDNEIFKRFGCVTILVVPVFDDGKFWGITLFERLTGDTFTEYETGALRSASFMLTNAIIRNEEAEAIQQANKQFQIILDALPLSITLWNRNREVINCSQYAVDLFGFSSKGEALERMAGCVPEYQPCGKRSADLMAESADEAFRTGYNRIEWTHLTAGGEPILFDANIIRIKYKDDDVLMLYSRDIREDKKMLAKLAERDKTLVEQAYWYKSLLDGIPLPISVTDPDMKLTFVNKVAGKLFGIAREEVIGRHCCIWNVPICNTADCSIVRAKQGLNQTFFKQNGLSYKVDSEIIRDLAGEPLGHLEVLHDITEVENMARQQADAANEAKTTFLANMSHEMRTPLNAIVGLSELTITSDRLDDEAQSNLIKIHNAGATLVSMVNDILDISKIEAGKFELVPIEYELPSLVNDVITQNAMRMEEKPIKFTLDIKKDLPMRLYGDELRVKEILNNLLSNAFKYTREGTVELKIRCARKNDTMLLTARVKDTGIGIREEDAARIFADYVQLDKKSNRTIQGTGLGLAITKRLVELMDGKITVKSEYGKGCAFTVRIKQRYVSGETIGPDMVQNLKNFRYIERKRRMNRHFVYLNMPYARVLVADDISTNLDVVKGMLKPYGMKVDCVSSGQEAVDAIRAEKVKYNAVFMDHMMPEMDGIEAVRIIREEIGTEYAKTIPVIALTANAIIGNEEKFLQAGFQAFISKPIELSYLDNAVREWVRDKEQESLLEEKQISISGSLVQDTRGGEERRRRKDRRSGIDRRILGSNIAGLDLAKGMERFGNDRNTYLDVMRYFAAGTRPLLDRIREPGSLSLKDYAIIVHGIKGSSWGIGAKPLGDKAETLEHAAKKGDGDFVAANNAGFIAAAEQLIAGIDEALRGQKALEPKPKKEKPDGETLERLLAACSDYDMDKADAAISEIDKWEYEAGGELAAWLKENVELMNFTEVQDKLSALLHKNAKGEQNVKHAG